MTDLYAAFNCCSAQWTLDCKGLRQKSERLQPGIYRVHWNSGGSSLAAIGCGYNGDNWIAPINWIRPGTIPGLEGDDRGSIKFLESIEVVA